MADNIAKLFVALGLDDKEFQKGLKGIDAKVKNLGKAMTGVGVAITGALGIAVKSAADFEGAMREVNSMMNLGQDDFNAFSDDVLQLSTRLGVDAVESARAMYQAISAGVPKENAISFLEVATNAAIGGVTDTATAVDGLSTVLNAFKMDTSEAKHVADVMFQTVANGKTNFPELAASMSTVAPMAAALGVGFEDVMAATATLTKQGVPTAQAMTQIRAAMVSLTKPTKEMEGLLQTMGYESGTAALEALGFQGTLEALTKASGGNQTVMAKALGSVESLSAVMALTGENAAAAAADIDSMATASDGLGAATKATNEVNQGANRQVTDLKEKLQGLGTQIGGALIPTLTALVQKIVPVIEKIIAWISENPKLMGTIVKIVAVVGGLMTVLGPVLMLLPAIAAALPVLGAAFAALLGPVGLVIAAIAGLVAAGIWLGNHWDQVTEWAKATGEKITHWFQDATVKIGIFFIELAAKITKPIDTAINWVIDKINGLIKLLNKIPGVNIGSIGYESGISSNLQGLADTARAGGPVGTAKTVHIPGFITGGIVPGNLGQPQLAVVHGGETITPAGKGMGTVNNFNVYPQNLISTKEELFREFREMLIRTKSINVTSGV